MARRVLVGIALLGGLVFGPWAWMPSDAAVLFPVTTTADGGPGSLRQAILDANARPTTAAKIVVFTIAASDPGFAAGVFTIRPTTALPILRDSVLIDGTTQTAFTGDSNRFGPEVVLNGGAAGAAAGITISGDGGGVQGLVVNGFATGTAIAIAYGTDADPSGNDILGNYLGTDPTGTSAVPNGAGIAVHGFASPWAQAADNLIEGNIVSGNAGPGITLCDAADTLILSNRVGVNRVGGPLGNAGDGIHLTCAGDPRSAIEDNVIAFNGGAGVIDRPDYRYPVSLTPDGHQGNGLRRNAIHANGGLGINLLPPPFGSTDQVTPNDHCDVDVGGNRLQNYPVLDSAGPASTPNSLTRDPTAASLTKIVGVLDSNPGETFDIELFASDVADPSGYGEGQRFLASVRVSTSAECTAGFSLDVPRAEAAGRFITATATASCSCGSTSEFSRALLAPAQAGTSVSLSSSRNPSTTGEVVSIRAQATAVPPATGVPTGRMRFAEGATELANPTIDADGAALYATATLAPGTHPITATYSGDSRYLGSSSTLTQTVDRGDAALVLSTSPNPSVVGQPVVLSATLSTIPPTNRAPTGTIRFSEGATQLASLPVVSGSATTTIADLAVGLHTIVVDYSGDTAFKPSSTTVLQTVGRGEAEMVLTSSPRPSVAGQAVTFTARLRPVEPATGSPTGRVRFAEGSNELGEVPVAGDGTAEHTTASLVVGPHTVTATYEGDPRFRGSTATVTHEVERGASTTALSASPEVSVAGDAVTLSATVGGVPPATGTPTGTVSFTDGRAKLAETPLDAAGTARLSTSMLAAGSRSITATFAGDSRYTASSATVTLTVDRRPTSVRLSSSANPSAAGRPVTLSATVVPLAPATYLPSGTVTFASSGIELAEVSVGVEAAPAQVTTTLEPGTHTILVTYSGDDRFAGSTATMTQIVDRPAPVPVTVPPLRPPSLQPGSAPSPPAQPAATAAPGPGSASTSASGRAPVPPPATAQTRPSSAEASARAAPGASAPGPAPVDREVTAAAAATPTGPRVVVAVPSVGRPGGVVTIRASGFPSSAPGELRWDRGIATARFSTGADGSFEVRVLVTTRERGRLAGTVAVGPDQAPVRLLVVPTAEHVGALAVAPAAGQPRPWFRGLTLPLPCVRTLGGGVACRPPPAGVLLAAAPGPPGIGVLGAGALPGPPDRGSAAVLAAMAFGAARLGRTRRPPARLSRGWRRSRARLTG